MDKMGITNLFLASAGEKLRKNYIFSGSTGTAAHAHAPIVPSTPMINTQKKKNKKWFEMSPEEILNEDSN